MIPTFNCAHLLRETLDSVLCQAPGSDAMEIVVVDDVSLKDDPEAVVREVGQGRVRFERNPVNLGAVANFNRCIELSRGELIHILHGDDCLEPGFYHEIGQLEEAHPDCALIAVRALAIEEDGVPMWLSPRLTSLEKGGRDIAPLLYSNPFQTPGVVVRRQFYEKSGGFRTALVHVADWEMWARAVQSAGGVASKWALARYRVFGGNDTGRLAQTGDNVKDYIRLMGVFSKYTGFNSKNFRRNCALLAKTQAIRFDKMGNTSASMANWKLYKELRDVYLTARDWIVSGMKLGIAGMRRFR